MDTITEQFGQALRIAYSELPHQRKTGVTEWLASELLAGHRPMCNDHSTLVLFMEYETLEHGTLGAIATGLYHKGTALIAPVLFSKETLELQRNHRTATAIHEFINTVMYELQLPGTSLVLHRSLSTMPMSMVMALVQGQMPITPQSVRAASDASHQLFHANDDFHDHYQHDSGRPDSAQVVDAWLKSLKEGE